MYGDHRDHAPRNQWLEMAAFCVALYDQPGLPWCLPGVSPYLKCTEMDDATQQALALLIVAAVVAIELSVVAMCGPGIDFPLGRGGWMARGS